MPYPNFPPQVSSYEVEFLAVGDGAKSGDAILASWVEPGGRRRIVVIDGGYQNTGAEIVELVRRRFGRNLIDLVISTHPDGDHQNGLIIVVTECAVTELLMHLPWEHGITGASLYSLGRKADQSLPAPTFRSLTTARELADVALEAGVIINEPFAGTTRLDGVVEILGPSLAYYESLLPEFRIAAHTGSLLDQLLTKSGSLVTRVRESLDIETLTDDGETSARNNTSAITQLNLNGERVLLTADAGIPALTRVADRLDGLGITPATLLLAQVPHHGSKRNVGPTVLDRLLGPRTGAETFRRAAVVSAAPDAEPKHPARQVTNAFRRRGTPVYATQGRCLRLDHNAPLANYGPATPLPFYPEVDE